MSSCVGLKQNLSCGKLTNEPMTISTQCEFLSVLQFARWTGLSRSLVYKLIDAGKLPFLRAGKAIRIPRSAVEALRAGPKATPADQQQTAQPSPRRRPRRGGAASTLDWKATFDL